MGIFGSRQNANVEEADVTANNAYKYPPPRSGNYFGSHFIMGGEKFDTPQPESYLFGENSDLNFLGSRPTPFPYPPPQANEPIKTLNCLVNIRKESLRFVRSPEGPVKCDSDDEDCEYHRSSSYNIEFIFDCDSSCAITVYYFCTEDVTPNGIVFKSRDPTMNSETFHYKEGAGQQFCQVSHTFNPSRFMDEELMFDSNHEMYPIAIHCVAEDGSEDCNQSHTTIAVVDHHTDGTYVLRALKQKLFVDGLSYLLQEIYGIENKNNETKQILADDDTEDNGSECVICMCDVRDTLILPCRHLCLCYSCADSLRYQANNCPICRAPFRALLQIRAVQKSGPLPQGIPLPADCADSLPPGYEAVSLIEALNGPYANRPTQAPVSPLNSVETPEQSEAIEAAEMLNRSGTDHSVSSRKLPGSPDNYDVDEVRFIKDQVYYNPDDIQLSVLIAKDKKQREKGVYSARVRPVSRSQSQEKRDGGKLNDDNTSQEFSEMVDDESDAERSPPHSDETASKITIEDIDDVNEDSSEPEAIVISPSANRKISQNGIASLEEVEGCNHVTTGAGEDSDYYTPEDPPTTVLSPLHDKAIVPGSSLQNSNASSSVESTPGRWTGTSIPGTPMSMNSHASYRSSGADSYSSSSSTKQLLAVAVSHNDVNTCPDKAVKL